MEDIVTIQTIFEELNAEKKVDQLMKEMDSELREHVSDMINFFGQNGKCETVYRLSIDDILMMFKSRFCEEVFERAIMIGIGPRKKYNMSENVQELLNADTVRKAMVSLLMIEAFSKALKNLDKKDQTKCIRCSFRKLCIGLSKK